MKKLVDKIIYGALIKDLKKVERSNILLVSKMLLFFTELFFILFMAGVIGVLINPVFGKIALGFILFDCSAMLLCMILCDEIESYRESLEKNFYDLYERFVLEFRDSDKIIYKKSNELVNTLGGLNFRRFIRILHKEKFSPNCKEDFLNFDFNNESLRKNPSFKVLRTDIKDIIKKA